MNIFANRESFTTGSEIPAPVSMRLHSGETAGFLRAAFWLYRRGIFSATGPGQICEYYNKYDAENSFIHYLWAIKATHAPLFKLATVAHQLSVATGAFHTVSTGFAGFLGVLLHYRTGRPLIPDRTRHLHQERKVDLQSLFIKEHRDLLGDALDMGMQYQELLWIRYFESLWLPHIQSLKPGYKSLRE